MQIVIWLGFGPLLPILEKWLQRSLMFIAQQGLLNKEVPLKPRIKGIKERHIRSFSSNRPTLIDFWPIKVSLIREEKRGAELGPILNVRLLNRALEQIRDHIWLVITHQPLLSIHFLFRTIQQVCDIRSRLYLANAGECPPAISQKWS